ncbi:uncharacterized protein PHACADRAFT_196455 [Phanerochaete carnosa HHB-10118-sp]|uniref:Uncharacterized protein n=1 Tax=Phanerochaete carnosa (strain HHB-10118-sp) TaxID=650164 RepID=K5WU91_PHACS|nr:uncharacterized protein PHACADRAFT_196455 [Phanerochaete carnosa HHB-10118-sp]EKM54017.1 hypothetical protein PHACADRAFT_196455 [Phanerochaete carnosa HHB-10118-sp]
MDLSSLKNSRDLFALAAYHFGRYRTTGSERMEGSKDDLMFQAFFDKPVLVSLCSHEMLLEITVTDGHCNLDHGRATEAAAANHSRKRDIPKNILFTYCVPSAVDKMAGCTALIGSERHGVQLLVFDYKSAKLVRSSVRATDGTHQPIPQVEGQQSLEFYLYQYLEFLQSAGHHTLSSLPGFEDDKGDVPTTINYSWIADVALRQLVQLDEIHSVSLWKINGYLSTVWLKAAMLVSIQTDALSDRSGTSLAEYRVTAWGNDEVIMTFVVDEVFLYSGTKWEGQPVKSFGEWEIAVIMNFSYEKPLEHDGNVIRCKVDIASSHLLTASSFFGDVDFDNEDATVLSWVDYIITFISNEYLNIIENAGYNIIYEHDLRRRSITGYGEVGDFDFDGSTDRYACRDGTEDSGMHARTMAWRKITQGDDMCDYDQITAHGRTAPEMTIWHEVAQKSDMYGFDQITALSQAAINMYYRSIWTQAEFKPPTVRLRGDGRAIVFLYIKRGFLKPLRNGAPYPDGDKFEFEDWRIAFEADLKMCDHSALTEIGPEWQAAFKKSRVYEQYGTSEIVDFKHIYLDFQNVTFLHESSRFDGLLTVLNKRSIDKVQAAVVYLRDFYLKQLVSAGHHVLYTIPVLNRPSAELYQCLTSVVFHIYSETSSEHSWNEQSRASEPIVIILGMCGGRPMPASALRYSTEWIVRVGRFSSYGTAAISGGLFLREKLLRKLSEINTRTTIIP